MWKFVFISILKPVFLKISIVSFHIWSVFCLDVFLKSTSPSFQYKPVDSLSSLFDNDMDVDKLAVFGTIKTAQGYVEASFCFFFSSKVLYHSVIRISCNVLSYARLVLEYQCIAGQTSH